MVPLVHEMQYANPVVLENFPARHREHTVRPLPAGLYRPVAHSMQTLFPEELVKAPPPQRAQSAPEPNPLANFPAVQGVQAVAPVAGL